MERKKLIKSAEELLERNDYLYVAIEGVRSCIDFIAERKGKKFAIKVVKNIDALGKEEISELYKVAKFIGAEPIVIGESSRNGLLKRNVTYKRSLVDCVTIDGLENRMNEIEQPIAAKSVGAKMYIDSTKFRNIMKLSNITAEELSKILGVSKATIYRYERGDTYASVAVLEKLNRLFGNEFAVGNRSVVGTVGAERSLWGKAKLESIRIRSMPFGMIAKGKINYYEVSFVADARTLAKRAKVLGSIKETFENNYPFFAMSRDRDRILGVPVINLKKLREIESESELLSVVE